MRKYIRRNSSDIQKSLCLGLTEIGKADKPHDHLETMRTKFPVSWNQFVSDVKDGTYLNKGLIVYQSLEFDNIDVAFIPVYDRYCNGDTMIYIFDLLRKNIVDNGIKYDEIVILGVDSLNQDFIKRLDVSFPIVFDEFKVVTEA